MTRASELTPVCRNQRNQHVVRAEPEAEHHRERHAAVHTGNSDLVARIKTAFLAVATGGLGSRVH